MNNYVTKSAVLLLLFNRPAPSQQVFARIRAAKPPRLYVAADGPRPDRAGEAALCGETRAVVQIDWPCNVQWLPREFNLGCRKAVSEAITWFFDQENEGIILEDDCLPADSFFYFCDTLLERYRHDERIHAITGTNLQFGKKWGDASYYFSRYTNIWGWASWKRVWERYDPSLSRYEVSEVPPLMQQLYNDAFLTKDWTENFSRLKSGEIDTWDHQLNFLTFFEHALCITPNVNLISNIGFGEGATHTLNTSNPHAAIPLGECWDIVHPESFLPFPQADYTFLAKEHHLAERWRIYNKKKNRFRSWLRTQLGMPVDRVG